MRPVTIDAPSATFSVRGRQWHLFHVCGVTGYVTAVAVAALLTWALRLSPGVMAVAAIAGAAILFALTYATTVILGREVIVNYHHMIAVSAVTALVAWTAGVPVVAHVAAFVVSLLVFMGFGRLGCLSAGCCHGRPAEWGIRYGKRHAASGFPAQLVGVVLLPTQLIDAAWAFTAAAAGAVSLIGGALPGVVLVTVAAAYAGGRFVTEFLRGDGDRPRLGGLSEAHWTSLILLCTAAGVAWATRAGPRIALAGFAVLAMAITLSWLLVRLRTSAPERRLLDPDHVLELAGAVAIARGGTTLADGRTLIADIHLATTSYGVSVSAGLVHGAAGPPVRHYTLSRDSDRLSHHAAQRLARTILSLRHPGCCGDLVAGQSGGTFHLLVPPPVQRPPRQNCITRISAKSVINELPLEGPSP